MLLQTFCSYVFTTYHCRDLNQCHVIAAESHNKQHGLNAIKACQPLPPLTPLAADVVQPENDRNQVYLRFGNNSPEKKTSHRNAQDVLYSKVFLSWICDCLSFCSAKEMSLYLYAFWQDQEITLCGSFSLQAFHLKASCCWVKSRWHR